MFSFNIYWVTQTVLAEMSLYFECGQGEIERNCSVYYNGDAAGEPNYCEEHLDMKRRRKPLEPLAEAPDYGPSSWAFTPEPEPLPHPVDWYIL